MAESSLQEQVTSLNEQVATLQETISTLTSERDSLRTRVESAEDALKERDARSIAQSAIADCGLRSSAMDRVIEKALVDEIPVDDQGSVDRNALTEKAQRLAEEERAYLAEAGGAGRVSGMGSGQPAGQGPKSAADYQALGLSEADAKAAARIHA